MVKLLILRCLMCNHNLQAINMSPYSDFYQSLKKLTGRTTDVETT